MDIQKQITHILREIGEDPEREGLLSTPKRVEKSYAYLMRGYNQNLKDVVNGAVFTSEADEMVIVRDIEFFSMCEHHMLPFFGHAHVGYIPKGKIIGVSKIARIVDMFARRLQVQERLTGQVAEALMEVLAGNYRMALGLMIIWGVAQLLRQIIQPKFVGDSIGVPAIPTLFLLFIGYRIGSVAGMILAVPVGIVIQKMFEAGLFDTTINSVRILLYGFNHFRKLEQEEIPPEEEKDEKKE